MNSKKNKQIGKFSKEYSTAHGVLFLTRMMRNFLVALFLFGFTTVTANAAKVTLLAPESAAQTGQPVTVQIFIDAEDDVLSGIAGNFSFPSDMFSLDAISLEDSVVSLWAVQPSLSEEKYLDNRTHLVFEGIFPGGYDGVRSPYYFNKKEGMLFSLTLLPKKKGKGVFLVDDISINAFNSDATPLVTTSASRLVTVPDLIPVKYGSSEATFMRVKSSTLSAFITRTSLVNNNAWYVVVNEREPISPIQKILIAETDDYDAEAVSESSWRSAKVPYVLLYQNRSKSTHIKVVYANHTYTTVTLPSVENFTSISYLSRILVGIGLVLALMYFYGKNIFTLFKKN